MQVASEVVSQGVAERPFELEHDGERVPGILWRPAEATGPTPLVLLGHGGTQHKRTPNVLGLARRFVRHLGVSAAALDAPGHGERVTDRQVADRARGDLERRLTSTRGVGSSPLELDDATRAQWAERNARGASEWAALLDDLTADGLVDGRIGYWGVSMGTAIGLPFVSADHRVTAAVLGLYGLGGAVASEGFEDAARALRAPVLFVFQWDDQLMTRESGLALFDAIGAPDKAMHVFPGGHIDTPMHERDAYDAFFRRHLVS